MTAAQKKRLEFEKDLKGNLAKHHVTDFERNVRRIESSDGTDPRLAHQKPGESAYGEYQMGPDARRDAGFEGTESLSKDRQRAAYLLFLPRNAQYASSALRNALDENDKKDAAIPKDWQVYAAYNLGAGGVKPFFSAKPGQKLADVYSNIPGGKSILAGSSLNPNWTAGEARAHYQKELGTGTTWNLSQESGPFGIRH